MNRWKGKIAVVTGASSGIGASICKELVVAGVTVVGLARRTIKIEEQSRSLILEDGLLFSRFCDITNVESIKAAFEWVETRFGGVNILINNAGIVRCTMFLAEDNEKDLQESMDTNYSGFVHCIKAAYRLMKKHNADGHIININSIFGNTPNLGSTFETVPLCNSYIPAKCAVVGMVEVIRQELNYLNNRKTVSPSFVKSKLMASGRFPDSEEAFRRFIHLQPEDIAQAVIYVLGTGPNVQVQDIVVRCVGDGF